MSFWKRFTRKSINFIPANHTSLSDYTFGIKNNVVNFDYNFKTSEEIVFGYYNVPQLQAVINYLASLAANTNQVVKEKLKDDQFKIIEDHWFTNVLQNPHPLYSEGEFIETYYKQYLLFGGVIVVNIKPVGFENPVGYFILPFQAVQVKTKDNLNASDIIYANDMSDIIDYYILNYNGKQTKIPTEDITVLSTTSLQIDENNFLVPDSPVTGLKQPLNNLLSQYKARNTIVDKRGALGILSNDSKDTSGTIPMKPEKKEEVQKEFRNYGLTGQDWQIVITDAAMKWQSMTMPIKDLQLIEGIKEDKIAVCDAYRFPILLLNSLEASTYNNLPIADKQVYTKKLIPDLNIISKSWTREYLQGNEIFEFDLSHVDALQEDRKVNVEIAKDEIEIVISLNQQITDGNMTKENAMHTLTLLTDINENDANLVLKEPIEEIIPVSGNPGPTEINNQGNE